MTAPAVLAQLGAAGVVAEAREGRLFLNPRPLVTPELMNKVRAVKGELLALLAANDQTTHATVAQAAHPAIPTVPCGGCGLSVWWQPRLGDRWRCDACDPHPDGWPRARTVDLDERRAIQAEPLLPPPGSTERDRLEARQQQMLTGLQAAVVQRPPSWWHPKPNSPPPGARCSCCRGREWWSRDRLGWCCTPCKPPLGEQFPELLIRETT